MSVAEMLGRLRARLAGETGPAGRPVASEPSEQDVGHDPRLAGSRRAGGEHEDLAADSGSVTGTGATDVFVGRVAGDDLGYAEQTGAERRRDRGQENPAGDRRSGPSQSPVGERDAMNRGEDDSPAGDDSTLTLRRAEAELVHLAAGVVRRRVRRGRYGELSAAAVNLMVTALTGAATGQHPLAGRRREVVAFAHRIVDDDHPERALLWPRPTPAMSSGRSPGPGDGPGQGVGGRTGGRAGPALPDPRDLPDDGLGQGPALSTVPATPGRGWR